MSAIWDVFQLLCTQMRIMQANKKWTSGMGEYTHGPNGTSARISWISRQEHATAWSTGEAALVAMGEGMRPALRNPLIGERVAGRDLEHDARDDANSAIGVIQKGYNPKKYVKKTQRVRGRSTRSLRAE